MDDKKHTAEFFRAYVGLLAATAPPGARAMNSPTHHTLLTEQEVADMVLHGNELLRALNAERKRESFKVVQDDKDQPNAS